MPPSSCMRCSTLLNTQHTPQAQRVTGCAAPRSGSALTRRWDMNTRSPSVGIRRADLPSGERPCLCSFRPHVHRFHAARKAKDRSELRTPAWTVAPALALSVACGTLAGRPLARQGRRRFASGCSSHAAASGSFYQQTKPPSTRRLTPVQNVDAWLARKTAGPIISSTVAIRPRGGVTPIGMATPL